MKVAFLIDRYENPHAGTERQLMMLTRQLKERGHEVRLGVLRHTPYTRSKAFPAPVDCLEIPRMRDLGALRRLYRWGRGLAADGYSLAQIFFNDASVLGPWPLKLAGLKVVVSRRDMGFWYNPGVLTGLRLSARAVHALVANSQAAGALACRQEWVPTSRLHVIANAPPAFDDAPAAQISPVPADALPPPAGGRIGIVANVRPVKRIDDLLRAYAALLPQHPHTDLVLVGGGDVQSARRLADELGIGSHFHATGQLADPAPWIRTFRIGVLCSASEGLSNAIMEYMHLGLPVVATDTGGNAELVEDEVTGLLVPVAHPLALAQALRRLLGDPQLAAAMGRAGARHLRERFSPERMVAEHLRLYRMLCPCPESGARAATGESS